MRHVLVMAPLDAAAMARLDAAHRVHRLDLAPDPEALLARVADDVEAVVTDGHRGLDAALIARLPRLRVVASGSAGVEGIDRGALAARGVPLSNVGPALAGEVADLALLLLLAAWHGLAALDAHVRTGAWAATGPAPLGRSLAGRRAGVAGAGPVGQAVARRLDALGMRVAVHARRDPGLSWPWEPDLLRLAGASDVLVLALPGGEATRGLAGREVIAALGPEGVLVNVGRGTVVDEDALAAALQGGGLGAAGLDVFATEPDVDPRLLRPNVVLTPHAGSATVETRAAMSALVVDALDAFFAGRPLPATLPPP